jgi:hypothetical protein
MRTGPNSAAGTYAGVLGTISTEGTQRQSQILSVFDYAATDKHKSVLLRHDGGYSDNSTCTEAIAARWVNTSSITTLTVGTSSSTFTIGSTFSLYGIVA